MKTAIVYYSYHHGNTEKVVKAMTVNHDVTLIDAAKIKAADLSEYDMIGFASGIYFSSFHKSVLSFARENLPCGKKVFFVYTCGAKKDTYTKSIKEIALKKSAKIMGEYGCLGFDTYGPFKLVGVIAKGHPDNDELCAAVKFYNDIP